MALAGDLSEFPLTDIIQLLDLSKKTGGVFVQGQRGTEQIEGWLYFRDGKICAATVKDLPPLEAAYTFFTLTSGPFQFHETPQPHQQTITKSNEFLIMEGIERQEAWARVQEQLPSPNVVLQLVANPAASSGEINVEPEEWRVLTMVNGRNTVGTIAQRSGLGELRTCQIVAQLLANGLIKKRDVHLNEVLFPELARIAASLGPEARDMLEEAYIQAGIRNLTSATAAQVESALETFSATAARTFGAGRVRQPLADMRAHAQQVWSSV